MNKFTQGKWIDNKHYTVESEDGKTIANCDHSTTGINEEEKANARLIASAPDMYKSLESHLSVLDDLYPSDATDISEAHMSEFIAVHGLINKTKELLKKARS